jgi:hypothetical protein
MTGSRAASRQLYISALIKEQRVVKRALKRSAHTRMSGGDVEFVRHTDLDRDKVAPKRGGGHLKDFAGRPLALDC